MKSFIQESGLLLCQARHIAFYHFTLIFIVIYLVVGLYKRGSLKELFYGQLRIFTKESYEVPTIASGISFGVLIVLMLAGISCE